MSWLKFRDKLPGLSLTWCSGVNTLTSTASLSIGALDLSFDEPLPCFPLLDVSFLDPDPSGLSSF
jgi:hypothetical protein